MTRQLDLTVQGVVGTHPLLSRVGSRNRPYCRFRVAVTPTYRTDQGWHNGETMWFTAKAWGQLAENISRSMHKGDPVLLSGRLAEDTWDSGSGERSSNVIVLQSAGHDLTRGETRFMRIKPVPATADSSDGEDRGEGADGGDGAQGAAGTGGTGGAASAGAVAGPAGSEGAGGAGVPGTAGSAGSAGSPTAPDSAPSALTPSWEPDAQGAGRDGDEQSPDPRGEGLVSPVPLVTVPQPPHRSADYMVVGELPDPVL